MGGLPAATMQVTASQTQQGLRLAGGPLQLMGWSFNDGVASQSLTVDQSAAAPGAGATIASISLPTGSYAVSWTLELTGTPGAGDVDNVQALIGATVLATSINLGAVGNYGQEEFTAQSVNGPVTLAWKTIGAATAGSTYKVEANITPINPASATIFDGTGAVGFSAIAPGGVDNQWFGDDGIAIDTELRVQSAVGTIQGVMYYFLARGHRDVGEQEPDKAG